MANGISVEKDTETHSTNNSQKNDLLNMKKQRTINNGSDVICAEMLTSGAAFGRRRNEATLVIIKQITHSRIGTWNVQSLY